MVKYLILRNSIKYILAVMAALYVTMAVGWLVCDQLVPKKFILFQNIVTMQCLFLGGFHF